MKTIILADDEANLRRLVHITLERPQYRIIETIDGPSTLERVRAEPPDLLVLDWMMPQMTGLEITRILRQETLTAQLPIIMLTARGRAEDRQQGEELGISAYLIKPFSPLELLELVEKILDTSGPEEGGAG